MQIVTKLNCNFLIVCSLLQYSTKAPTCKVAQFLINGPFAKYFPNTVQIVTKKQKASNQAQLEDRTPKKSKILGSGPHVDISHYPDQAKLCPRCRKMCFQKKKSAYKFFFFWWQVVKVSKCQHCQRKLVKTQNRALKGKKHLLCRFGTR